MSTATLTLSDTGGAIDAHIDFGPAGFQKDSHAHQHAMLLVKIDRNAVAKVTPRVESTCTWLTSSI